jgi:hypothetical protein
MSDEEDDEEEEKAEEMSVVGRCSWYQCSGFVGYR